MPPSLVIASGEPGLGCHGSSPLCHLLVPRKGLELLAARIPAIRAGAPRAEGLCSPERLPEFWCVDSVQANLVLAVVNVQQRDGVAIRHAHYVHSAELDSRATVAIRI